MIDITKQYTYQGKPVRIYSDGSDTAGGALHCAALSDDSDTKCKWYLIALYESDLVEVWEPVVGEWVWKDTEFVKITAIRNHHREDGLLTYSCSVPCRGESFSSSFKPERFIGTLPEAFKGL